MILTNVHTVKKHCLRLLFYFIALKEDTEIQTDEDKSSPDEGTPHVSSNQTARPNVSQQVNQNTTIVVVHSCSQDTKL